MPKPIIAVVGRPNVGKSTLFNRLTGRRIAIVQDQPGITRDRLYADGDWNGRGYTLIDTGGIMMDDADPLLTQIRLQAEVAMEESDVILFLVDGETGITESDRDLANHLRRTDTPLFLVINKADNAKRDMNAADFYQLGVGELFSVSALSGRGVADLLDEVVKSFPPDTGEQAAEDASIKIALVGRPNVGKSSMLNAILGEERCIVSPIAGTTRDAIDTKLVWEGNDLTLIDTAGIRRSGKIQGTVEYYSVLRAQRAIERADVAVTVIDSIEGLLDGDKRVAGMGHDAGRAAVLVANKWDEGKQYVLEANPGQNPIHSFTQHLRDEMPFVSYASVAYCSALLGTGIGAAVETMLAAAEGHAFRIPTGELNRIVRDAVDAHPLNDKGRTFKVRYVTMAAVKPPTIVMFVNDPDMLHFSYKRYIENQIRKVYPFEGTPIRLFARKADDKREDGKGQPS